MNATYPSSRPDRQSPLLRFSTGSSTEVNTDIESRRLLDDQQLESMLRVHYTLFKKYLSASLQEEDNSPELIKKKTHNKLLLLSRVQFWELSTDIYDELLRRQAASQKTSDRELPGSVHPHLLTEKNFHPLRNRSRQMLSTLLEPRFRNLAADIVSELEQRLLTFADDNTNPVRHPVSIIGSDGTGIPFNVSVGPRMEKSLVTSCAASSTVLCNVCASMFESYTQEGSHHQRAKDLATAAARGCQICTPMFDRFMRNGGHVHDERHRLNETFLNYSFSRLPNSNDWRLHISGVWTEYGSSPLSGTEYRDFIDESYRIIPKTAAGSSTIRHSMEISSWTGHDSVLELGSKWLKNCFQTHNCDAHRNTSWVPTRLIDVTGVKPRLLLSSLEKPKGPYATLSHCWGPRPTFLQLTADNLDQLQLEIPLDSLPQTFRDAIKVTKSLSIGYLWIDSLCILQLGKGSTEDWLQQSREMSSIYSNCLINIAASRSEDANMGCFALRNRLLIRPCEIIWHSLTPGRSRYTVVLEDFCYHDLKTTPLGKRGWVLQERLLSPRILSFGREQLFWECSELGDACEAFPCGVPGKIAVGNGTCPFSLSTALASGNPFTTWSQIIHDYTCRDLTKPFEDKFIALGAIANLAAVLLNDTYLAGHFRKSLFPSLLWTIWGENLVNKTAKRWLGPYRAPSWSWASIDGPIMLTDVFNGSVVATLEEVQLGFVDEKNKTGQLRSARLKIRAVVGSAAWAIPKPFQIFHLGFAIDGTDAALPSPGAVQMLSFDHFEEIFSDQQGAIAVVLAESVYADSKELQGLVLKPAGTGSDKTYRRIGAWRIQGKDVDMIRFFRDIEPKVIAIV